MYLLILGRFKQNIEKTKKALLYIILGKEKSLKKFICLIKKELRDDDKNHLKYIFLFYLIVIIV